MKLKKVAAAVLACVGLATATGMPAAVAAPVPWGWTDPYGRGHKAAPRLEYKPARDQVARPSNTHEEVDRVPVRRPEHVDHHKGN